MTMQYETPYGERQTLKELIDGGKPLIFQVGNAWLVRKDAGPTTTAPVIPVQAVQIDNDNTRFRVTGMDGELTDWISTWGWGYTQTQEPEVVPPVPGFQA